MEAPARRRAAPFGVRPRTPTPTPTTTVAARLSMSTRTKLALVILSVVVLATCLLMLVATTAADSLSSASVRSLIADCLRHGGPRSRDARWLWRDVSAALGNPVGTGVVAYLVGMSMLLAFLGLVNLTFGQLRPQELAQAKALAAKSLVLKLIIEWTTIVPHGKLLPWVVWACLDSTTRAFSGINRVRLEHVMASPHTALRLQSRVLQRLVGTSVAVVCACALAVAMRQHLGWAWVLLILADGANTLVHSAYSLSLFRLHRRELSGVSDDMPMEQPRHRFIKDVAIGVLDLATVAVIFFANDIFRNFLLQLCMLRHALLVWAKLQKRMAEYRDFSRVTRELETRFAMATPEELAAHADDVCVICRESMTSACKLTCGHLFHMRCLHAWMQQQSTCPTCRYRRSFPGVVVPRTGMQAGGGPVAAPAAPTEPLPPPVGARTTTFRVGLGGGQGWRRWLPQLSIEVYRRMPWQRATISPEQLADLVVRVQAVLPHVPRRVIVADLQQTRSSQLTIENVLDGHVRWEDEFAPPPGSVPPSAPTPAAPATAQPAAATAASGRHLPAKDQTLTRPEFEERKRRMLEAGRRRYAAAQARRRAATGAPLAPPQAAHAATGAASGESSSPMLRFRATAVRRIARPQPAANHTSSLG